MGDGMSKTLRKCSECEKVILRKNKRALTCSDDCSTKRIKTKMSILNEHRVWGVSTGTTGAIHELVVSVDLMKRGLHVFRAMSPSCPCDLAVICDGKLLRIEVTTGFLLASGRIHVPSKNEKNFDVLAVVHGGVIHYQPDLPKSIAVSKAS